MFAGVSLRYGIVAASTPGVTATDAASAQPDATQRPKTLDCLVCVLRTARLVPAACAKRGGDRPLVEADQRQQQVPHWPAAAAPAVTGSCCPALSATVKRLFPTEQAVVAYTLRHSLTQLPKTRQCARRLRCDDDVMALPGAQPPQDFAQLALRPVAHHRLANSSPHGEPVAAVREPVAPGGEAHESVPRPAPVAQRRDEVLAASKPPRLPPGGWHRAV